MKILIKLRKRLRLMDITTQEATRHEPSSGYRYLVRVFDRYLQSLFELQDGRMYNCNQFRERSVGMGQARARIYSEASPPEIYGSPDSSAVGNTARASSCWQRSGRVSNLSRAQEFTELRRSHWRSCASSKRLSRMSTENGAGDQIWQYKTIHSINPTSFTCEMELLVDLQGFTKPINEFVLKELAALKVNNSNNTPVIIVFEPSCDWNILPAEYKVTNSWLQRNYHGIPWSSGNSPYAAAGPIIRGFLQRAHTIYVKGLEKPKQTNRRFGQSSLKRMMKIYNTGFI